MKFGKVFSGVAVVAIVLAAFAVAQGSTAELKDMSLTEMNTVVGGCGFYCSLWSNYCTSESCSDYKKVVGTGITAYRCLGCEDGYWCNTSDNAVCKSLYWNCNENCSVCDNGTTIVVGTHCIDGAN